MNYHASAALTRYTAPQQRTDSMLCRRLPSGSCRYVLFYSYLFTGSVDWSCYNAHRSRLSLETGLHEVLWGAYQVTRGYVMKDKYTVEELAAQLKQDLAEGESWYIEFKEYDHIQLALEKVAKERKDELAD